jgi:hypothetical protein
MNFIEREFGVEVSESTVCKALAEAKKLALFDDVFRDYCYIERKKIDHNYSRSFIHLQFISGFIIQP